MTVDIKDKFERLPTFAQPKNYKIWLRVDLENSTFKGTTKIVLKVGDFERFGLQNAIKSLQLVEPTRQICLHACELKFSSSSLTLADGKSEIFNHFAWDSKHIFFSEWKNLATQSNKRWGTLTIDLEDELQPQDDVALEFTYSGVLHTGMRGFYASTYTDKDGKTRKMATSQFESEWARLVFPCFDEPTFKATFDVELETEASLVALSNMHVVHEEATSDGWTLRRFATTPKMSSYLVAFAVGDFEHIEVRVEKAAARFAAAARVLGYNQRRHSHARLYASRQKTTCRICARHRRSNDRFLHGILRFCDAAKEGRSSRRSGF